MTRFCEILLFPCVPVELSCFLLCRIWNVNNHVECLLHKAIPAKNEQGPVGSEDRNYICSDCT